jgi:hypothetical protein
MDISHSRCWKVETWNLGDYMSHNWLNYQCMSHNSYRISHISKSYYSWKNQRDIRYGMCFHQGKENQIANHMIGMSLDYLPCTYSMALGTANINWTHLRSNGLGISSSSGWRRECWSQSSYCKKGKSLDCNSSMTSMAHCKGKKDSFHLWLGQSKIHH